MTRPTSDHGGLFLLSPKDPGGRSEGLLPREGGSGGGAVLRGHDAADRRLRRRLLGRLRGRHGGGARALHGRDLPRAAGRQILSGEVQRGERDRPVMSCVLHILKIG